MSFRSRSRGRGISLCFGGSELKSGWCVGGRKNQGEIPLPRLRDRNDTRRATNHRVVEAALVAALGQSSRGSGTPTSNPQGNHEGCPYECS